jgi:hypothetical protein
MYFRGPVLSEFDGREWRPLLARLGTRFPPPRPAIRSSPASARRCATSSRWSRTTVPGCSRWTPRRRRRACLGLEAAMTSELQWVASQPVVDLLRYQAESYRQLPPRAAVARLVPAEYRQLPAGFNPRTLELAATLMRDNPRDPQALVQAALRQLRTGGYTYTLEPGVYGAHTADEFWFDRKEASASTSPRPSWC